jgi:Mg-chelatase subunit ChlD
MRRLAVLLLCACLAGLTRAGDDLDLPLDPKPDPPKPPPKQVTVAAAPAKAPPPVQTYDAPPQSLPPEIYGKDLKSASASLVYVIDISGSMDNTDGQPTTRLERAKRELERSLASLPQTFRFNVLAYDCSYSTRFDGGGTGSLGLATADPTHIAKAQTWVADLKAGGATGTGPSVCAALSERDNLLVVVLTDGAPNCGAGPGLDNDPNTLAAHLSMVKWFNEQHAEIDVFGIGATGAFRQFCLDLAQQNAGGYQDVR